jgi:shikimate 5-dehydrogenase
VNATPVGRDTQEVPFELERLNDDAVVIDLVYGSRPTPLIDTTRARRQIAIDGRDVLVTQVRHQFRLMTGKEMSITLAQQVLSHQNHK